MTEALAEMSASFDFVYLSNILDWRRAREGPGHSGVGLAGGRTLIRQLNSTLDIPGLGPMFDWLTPEAKELHARDSSFFYRALHLGRKR